MSDTIKCKITQAGLPPAPSLLAFSDQDDARRAEPTAGCLLKRQRGSAHRKDKTLTLSHESRLFLTLLFLLALYMFCEWAGEIPWSAP